MNADAILALVLASAVALTAEQVAVQLGYGDAEDVVDEVTDALMGAILAHTVRAASTFGLVHYGTTAALRNVPGYERIESRVGWP